MLSGDEFYGDDITSGPEAEAASFGFLDDSELVEHSYHDEHVEECRPCRRARNARVAIFGS